MEGWQGEVGMGWGERYWKGEGWEGWKGEENCFCIANTLQL